MAKGVIQKETVGKVIAVKKQWWLKINTKPFRRGTFDGAKFPYIITVSYAVDGKEYKKRKWIWIDERCPEKGENVTVVYEENKPRKSKIIV